MDFETSLKIYRGNGGPELGEIVLVTDVLSRPGISSSMGHYVFLPDLDLCSGGTELVDHAFQRAYRDEPVARDMPGLEAAAFERARGGLDSLIKAQASEKAEFHAACLEQIVYEPDPSAIGELVRRGRFPAFFQRVRTVRGTNALKEHLAELGIEPAADDGSRSAAPETRQSRQEAPGPEAPAPVSEERIEEMRRELERLQAVHDDAWRARNYDLSALTERRILESERELARAENTEYALPLSGLEWLPGIHPPSVWSHGRHLWMIYEAPGGRFRMMKFDTVSGYRWTQTSDAMDELPLYGRGFEVNRAMEVIDSKWLRVLKTGYEDSPHRAGVHHYVFCFWDSMVEVIACSFEWNSGERSLAEWMVEATGAAG